MRPSDRKNNEMRSISFEIGVSKHAEGSCLVKFGNTHVICTASIEERVPMWLRGKQKGWITAEYGMIPRATHSRVDRDISKGKISGRSQEIQRLIGRSLRSAINLNELGERQIKIDCDVIQADGGTRTASITGAWIALSLACEQLLQEGKISCLPLRDQVAAVSCGITEAGAVLDLDYTEDSSAHTDANFVLTASGGIVEIQGTAEQTPFTPEQFSQMLSLAQNACAALFSQQLITSRQLRPA